MKKIKCKVCGKRFAPVKGELYLATRKAAALKVLTEDPTTFECFDCPRCGCQCAVGVRKGGGDDEREKE